jgi:acid phosphatase type 7
MWCSVHQNPNKREREMQRQEAQGASGREEHLVKRYEIDRSIMNERSPCGERATDELHTFEDSYQPGDDSLTIRSSKTGSETVISEFDAAQLPTSTASIIRGPYLQCGTDCSVVIRWSTDLPSISVVSVGDEPGQLHEVYRGTTLAREHEVELVGFSAQTKYFYSIGDGSGAVAGGADTYFVTAPSEGAAKPTRVWVIGDSGRDNQDQREVYHAYERAQPEVHTDLWMMLGDNAYLDGTLDQYQRGLFDIYQPLLKRSVLWTAIGNHDGHSVNAAHEQGPYYDLFTFPKYGEAGGVPSMRGAYYSFDYGNIHFVCLDSWGSDRSRDGAMMQWAAQDIASTDKEWIVAFLHHPPYTKGSHDSDLERELIEVREEIIPVLENAGVDLVLAGHSHSYERSFLMHGHYGRSTQIDPSVIVDSGSGREEEGPYRKGTRDVGTVYVVAGTSGLADHVTSHPAMFTSMSVPGSLILDVDGGVMVASFLDHHGTIRDTFVIDKRGTAEA